MTTPKDIIKNFYNSDFANDPNIYKNFMHPEGCLNWNSSRGFTKLNQEQLTALLKDINSSYESVRIQISHLLEDGNFVTVRYTLYVTTIEDPDEERPMAHFITIWELRDGKLFLGHEISQLADESPVSLNSYEEIKL